MRNKLAILTLSVLLVIVAIPAKAQNRARAFTISPFVGGYMFDCFQRLDNNWYYGMRLGYNLTEHWGIEGMAGYVPTEGDFDPYVNVWRYAGEIQYNLFPKSRFVPFVALGAGGIQINDSPGPNDHDRAMFDYGLGLKLFITRNLALRADVRHDLFCEFDEACSNLEYTGGLTFQFGGKEKVVEAAPLPIEEEAAPAPVVVAPIVEAAPPPKPKPRIVLIELDDTHFAHDSSDLTPAGKLILDDHVRTMKANPTLNIMVAGYASASGTTEYNQKLSERRANAVRNYMIAGGIAPARLQQIGYGETRPAEYEPYINDIESRAAKANRRVLFTIIVK